MTDYTNWEEALFNQPSPTWNSTLCHHGTKGQKWGRRRYQNEDGSLTPAGREHYGVGEKREPGGLKGLFKSKKKKVSQMTDEELKRAIERRKLEKEYHDANPYKSVLEKGVDLVKGAIDSHNARKAAEQEQKIKNKELDVRKSEVKAKEAEAESKRLSAEAESNKWKYYTKNPIGMMDHMRQSKAEQTSAKAEVKTAKALNRAKNPFFGDTGIGHSLASVMGTLVTSISTIGMSSSDRQKTLSAFYNSNKTVSVTNLGFNGKKK